MSKLLRHTKQNVCIQDKKKSGTYLDSRSGRQPRSRLSSTEQLIPSGSGPLSLLVWRGSRELLPAEEERDPRGGGVAKRQKSTSKLADETLLCSRKPPARPSSRPARLSPSCVGVGHANATTLLPPRSHLWDGVPCGNITYPHFDVAVPLAI